MSNFRSKAFNPASKRVEVAEYCDDYYGRHRYGIRFDDGCVHPEAQCGIDAAAAQLDALQARVKELEAERDKWDRRTAYDELKAREFENRATQQRQIDALTIRAEAAESRALRAEQDRADEWNRRREAESQCDVAKAAVDTLRQERDEEEQRGDEATRRMTDLSNELHRVRQELDEAYERAAKIIDAECERILSKQTPTNDPLSMEDAVNQHLRMIACILPDLAAAIRRLAGPGKEGE